MRTEAAPKKSKRNKKKREKSKAKKKLEITSEEDYVPPTETPFTLQDYIPKGFFGNDSSNDEPAEKKWPNVVWFHGLMSVKS